MKGTMPAADNPSRLATAAFASRAGARSYKYTTGPRHRVPGPCRRPPPHNGDNASGRFPVGGRPSGRPPKRSDDRRIRFARWGALLQASCRAVDFGGELRPTANRR